MTSSKSTQAVAAVLGASGEGGASKREIYKKAKVASASCAPVKACNEAGVASPSVTNGATRTQCEAPPV